MSRSARRPARRAAARPARWRWSLIVPILAALVVGGAVLWWFMLRPTPRPPFDAARAFADVERQVAFGPRIPGTAAHDATLAWLVARLDALGARVDAQPVAFRDPGDSTRIVSGTNVLASFRPDLDRRVMLAAHWDTRPVADNDPDSTRRAEPVAGANDGASGVAVLLEIGRLLAHNPPDLDAGVDLVFFDLEDLGSGDDGRPAAQKIPFAAGSELFAQANPDYRPLWGVLLDMVGDRGLVLPKEAYSVQYAPDVVRRVWGAAARAGSPAFVDRVGWPVEDDHLPFLRRGIPVANVIQTPFPATWHTVSDTPENVSAESLGQVGRALVEVLWGG